jgi:glutamine synthetase
MELRLGDATANPYLATAAIGAGVCLGLRDQVAPPAKLEGCGYDPARSERLPLRLAEALDALEADRELADLLGDYFVTSFLTYKRDAIRAVRHRLRVPRVRLPLVTPTTPPPPPFRPGQCAVP